MLNISHNKLNTSVDISNFKSSKRVFHKTNYKTFNRFLIAFAILIFIILFLPWTQNISSNGSVTTLKLDQRPQTIQSPIPGRIEKWFVQEGDFVKKGDTILFISEIKNEYLDPKLIERTGKQIKAKSMSVFSYQEKIKALNRQISSLQNERSLKLEQSKNKLMQSFLKVKSDSIDYQAAVINLNVAQLQYDRTVTLENEGLKAVTDVEEKRMKLQENLAKLISQENKLLASRNEILNAKLELNRIKAEYTDKISKAQSDMFTAQSSQYDSEVQVTKLENDYVNYEKKERILLYQSFTKRIYQQSFTGRDR